jgi:hypothetical protein
MFFQGMSGGEGQPGKASMISKATSAIRKRHSEGYAQPPLRAFIELAIWLQYRSLSHNAQA